MIVTVSPNLALDRVHVVQGFQAGEQSRAITSFLQPGGSGVHAASIIQALGGQAVALGLLGGQTGELWKAEAARRGLAYDLVPIPAETRESFCLIDLDLGNIVESVEEGPRVDSVSLPLLLERLEQHLPKAEMLILSGSLPPGFPDSGYVEMLALAKRYGVPAIADLHGDQLRMILGHRPWLVKPSLAEFHALVGHRTADLHERALICEELCKEYGVIIALSLSAEGLLITGPDGQCRVKPPRMGVHLPGGRGRNVIGCGDALVGALAHEYCCTGSLADAVRLGVAAAHYNLGTLGVPEIDAAETRRLAESVTLEFEKLR